VPRHAERIRVKTVADPGGVGRDVAWVKRFTKHPCGFRRCHRFEVYVALLLVVA
jgi:hypothetical protein